MTREEQTQLIEKLVTELAKSRTCDECDNSKYSAYSAGYCECWEEVGNYLTEDGELLCTKDFGCNKWEAKTVSTDTKS